MGLAAQGRGVTMGADFSASLAELSRWAPGKTAATLNRTLALNRTTSRRFSGIKGRPLQPTAQKLDLGAHRSELASGFGRRRTGLKLPTIAVAISKAVPSYSTGRFNTAQSRIKPSPRRPLHSGRGLRFVVARGPITGVTCAGPGVRATGRTCPRFAARRTKPRPWNHRSGR